MSKISIKTSEDLDAMRASCRLAAQALAMIEPHVVPGVTTNELDRIVHEWIVAHDAHPSPLNYHGFPKSICTSINQQVCHGIPSDRALAKGDIVNVDITVYYRGFHGDTSATFFVGEPSAKARHVTDVAHHALWLGIDQVKPGATLGDIGQTIQQYVESKRCGVVREYCGHGIGREFHEPPTVLHYGRRGEGAVLKPGMTFTIEPMVNLGKPAIKVLPDGWTVVTRDRSLSAQFEHTVLVTEDGFEVLTLAEESTARARRLD